MMPNVKDKRSHSIACIRSPSMGSSVKLRFSDQVVVSPTEPTRQPLPKRLYSISIAASRPKLIRSMHNGVRCGKLK